MYLFSFESTQSKQSFRQWSRRVGIRDTDLAHARNNAVRLIIVDKLKTIVLSLIQFDEIYSIILSKYFIVFDKISLKFQLSMGINQGALTNGPVERHLNSGLKMK